MRDLSFFHYSGKFKGLDCVSRVVALDSPAFQSQDDDPDYYIYPRWLRSDKKTGRHLNNKILTSGAVRLAHWESHRSRHIFFDGTDAPGPIDIGAMYMRVSCVGKPVHNTHSIPYSQKESSYNLSREPRTPTKLLSFCGDTKPWLRTEMANMAEKRFGKHATIIRTHRSFRKVASHQKTFADNILSAHFVLCPRGSGPTTYRLFETMAAGRVPVIISPGYTLPFSHTIDWTSFSYLATTTKEALDWVQGCSSQDALGMGKCAQTAWYEYIRDCQWHKSICALLKPKG